MLSTAFQNPESSIYNAAHQRKQHAVDAHGWTKRAGPAKGPGARPVGASDAGPLLQEVPCRGEQVVGSNTSTGAHLPADLPRPSAPPHHAAPALLPIACAST